MMRYLIPALLAILPLMQGCVPLVIGGAAATTAVVATDRRTVGTMTEDENIEVRVAGRLRDRYGNDLNVSPTSYNRSVLLTGQAPDAKTRAEAETIARSVQNVREVYNEIIVAGASSMTSRSNDSIITSKVKGRLVDSGKVNAIHIKVVTDNGIVYLMGLVSKAEADAATEVARTTSGVQKVVRAFEYIK
jgi:osmotically-inducible protein OsmY